MKKKEQINRIDERKIIKNVLDILDKFNQSGKTSFIVGGCVRDLLLNREVRDWDILTDARVQEIQSIFSKYKTFMIGKSFLTVTLLSNGERYDISTLRGHLRSKTPGKRGMDQGMGSIAQDLIDRDFTINSMAWNKNMGLLDPTNGLKDLFKRRIRSLNPDQKFLEDPVRMIRAVRIACELGFKISHKTKESIYRNILFIHSISPERIGKEMISILKSPDAARGIQLMESMSLIPAILGSDQRKKILLPDRNRMRKEVFVSTLNRAKEDLTIQLSLLGRVFFGSCKSANLFFQPFLSYLKLKQKILNKVDLFLSVEWEDLDFSSGKSVRFLFNQFGKQNVLSLLYLKEFLILSEGRACQINFREYEKNITDELHKNPPTSTDDLAINGHDLINIGILEGRKVGIILKALLNEVLKEPEKNTKKQLIYMAERMRRENRINKKEND